MTKEVRISISGLQTSEESEIEVFLPGTYYVREGTHYIRYTEIAEDETTPTDNLIKIRENSLEVIRKGAVSARMVFEVGRKTETCYRTPFGDLNMGIKTKSMKWAKSDDCPEAQIEYKLDVNESYQTDCSIAIKVIPL